MAKRRAPKRKAPTRKRSKRALQARRRSLAAKRGWETRARNRRAEAAREGWRKRRALDNLAKDAGLTKSRTRKLKKLKGREQREFIAATGKPLVSEFEYKRKGIRFSVTRYFEDPDNLTPLQARIVMSEVFAELYKRVPPETRENPYRGWGAGAILVEADENEGTEEVHWLNFSGFNRNFNLAALAGQSGIEAALKANRRTEVWKYDLKQAFLVGCFASSYLFRRLRGRPAQKRAMERATKQRKQGKRRGKVRTKARTRRHQTRRRMGHRSK